MLDCGTRKAWRFLFCAAGFVGLNWPQLLSAQTPTVTEFPVTTATSGVVGITAGPDGNLWFTEANGNNIGRITTAGVVTEFPVLTASSTIFGITAGPDGNLWFTERDVNQIGRITTAGVVTEFPVTTANSQPLMIVAGPDGALWFTENANAANKIGRITTTGTVTEFPIPTAASGAAGITSGPDGNLWFGEQFGNKIGRITPAGIITEFPIPTATSFPQSITVGPDGALWFTEQFSNKIGRVTTAGTITEFIVPPTGDPQPYGIAAGPDGALWFIEANVSKVGRITTTGAVTAYAIPTVGSATFFITAGPDNALWFGEFNGNAIGRITTLMMQTSPSANIVASGDLGGPFAPASFNYTFNVTTAGIGYTITGVPSWLTASSTSGTLNPPGAAITFTLNASANLLAPATYGPATITITNTSSGLGNTTRTATLTVGPVDPTSVLSAVLPASRSVQIGTAATAFSTIINTGSKAGINCGLALGTAIPASFAYQTTDPATNQVNGTANTPVNIPPGGNQSYVFALTPSGAFDATDVQITAKCANSDAAPTVVGLNTLLISGSATPVPDIVALGATAGNDGIVNIPGVSGTGAFAVASVNVGVGSAITVSADTGAASLPVQISLCETNPSSGQCISAIGSSVTTTINANATPTFAFFVKGTANVPFDPANSRIFVRFKDPGGVTRGATSVAVRTK